MKLGVAQRRVHHFGQYLDRESCGRLPATSQSTVSLRAMSRAQIAVAAVWLVFIYLVCKFPRIPRATRRININGEPPFDTRVGHVDMEWSLLSGVERRADPL
jgi:hypothetical protein